MDHLRAINHKKNTINIHHNNVHRCLLFSWSDNRSTKAEDIYPNNIQYLWRNIPLREKVRISYFRNLSCMVTHYIGVDMIKHRGILRNREPREKVFISDDDLRTISTTIDPFQRLIICLGPTWASGGWDIFHQRL